MSGSVIILGAGVAKGVGGALARRFSTGGHHVIIAGRTDAKVQALAEEIRQSGRSAEPLRLDVTSEYAVDDGAGFENRYVSVFKYRHPAQRMAGAVFV